MPQREKRRPDVAGQIRLEQERPGTNAAARRSLSCNDRGPDGQGRFRDRAVRADGSVVDVAFVHRRMAIIDIAGGHQPMVWRGHGSVRAPSASSGMPADSAGRGLLSPAELEAYTRSV